MLPKKHLISIIVPFFNEEEVIESTIKRLLSIKSKHSKIINFEFIFIDDGSTDNSLSILKKATLRNKFIKVVSFTRNFGHQIALTSGLKIAKGDYIAIIDADLQDPPELIIAMYRKALAGFDVVYGQRKKRIGETFFKKITSTGFYKLLTYLCDFPIPENTGDFRLISRRVAHSLNAMNERHKFIRGMIPWLGFKSIGIFYDRQARFAGETKYPISKMVSFASNAILSFSTKPLTLAIRLGAISFLTGFLGGFYLLYQKLFIGSPIPGLTATILTMLIFFGVQIIILGFLGVYIAKIYEETKQRPLFVINEEINL